MILDALGHLAYVFLALGTLLVARAPRKARGWLCRLTGTLLWGLIGAAMGMTSIWFWSAVFLVVDAVGLTKAVKRNAPWSPTGRPSRS